MSPAAVVIVAAAVGTACGIVAVVAGGYHNSTAVLGNIHTLDALIGLGDVHIGRVIIAAGAADNQSVVTVCTVVCGGKGHAAAQQLHIAAAVQAVVGGVNGDRTAVDDQVAAALPCSAGLIIQPDCFDALGTDVSLAGVAVTAHAAAPAAGSIAGKVRALICGNIQVAAVHGEGLLCLNAVCIRIDVDCTAVDGDIALIRFGGVALDAVAAGAAVVGVHRHRQSAVIGGIRVADADGVVAANAVICGVDGNAAVPDLQVILADDAVLGVAVDDQRALALQLQVVAGEDRPVDRIGVAVAVHIGVRVGRAVRNGIGRAVLGRDLHFVTDRLHIDRGNAVVGQGQSLQIQHHFALWFRGLIHVDGKLSAGAFTADREFAGSGNRYIGSGDRQVRGVGNYTAGSVGRRDAAAAVDQSRCHSVVRRCHAAAGEFLYAGELGEGAGHGKGAVIGTVVCHLGAAGV